MESDKLRDKEDDDTKKKKKKKKAEDEESDEEEEEKPKRRTTNSHLHRPTTSGSTQSKTFLSQIDTILAAIPPTATRALFSATIGPTVRHLAESILRNPIDITIVNNSTNTSSSSVASGINSNIRQSLQFVGREEGKLLAIRQMIQKGIKPPILIFLQSQDRAQALFHELLYDYPAVRVDVLHAGRSQAARDRAVTQFRTGDTWILICTDLCARGIDFKAANVVINYDLPENGVTYVHRIGRTGRGGRTGEAITFFSEADFPQLRKIANVMKLSGCPDVPEWMLTLNNKSRTGSRSRSGPHDGEGGHHHPHHHTNRSHHKAKVIKRQDIDTTPIYDKRKQQKRKLSIQNSLKNKTANKKNKEN